MRWAALDSIARARTIRRRAAWLAGVVTVAAAPALAYPPCGPGQSPNGTGEAPVCYPPYAPPTAISGWVSMWPALWGLLVAALVIAVIVRSSNAANRSVAARSSVARQRRVVAGFGVLLSAWLAVLAAPFPGDLRVRAIAVGLAVVGAVLAAAPVARYAGALRAVRGGRVYAGTLQRDHAGLSFASEQLPGAVDVRDAERVGFRAPGDDEGPCVLIVRDPPAAIANAPGGPFRSDGPTMLLTAHMLVAGSRAEAIAELRAKALDVASRAFWITVAFTMVAVVTVDVHT